MFSERYKEMELCEKEAFLEIIVRVFLKHPVQASSFYINSIAIIKKIGIKMVNLSF